MAKIYFEGQYFYTEAINKKDLQVKNPRAFAYLSKKLGWNTKQMTDESINITNTEKKSGQTRQTKGDIQQRSGQRVPAKNRKIHK